MTVASGVAVTVHLVWTEMRLLSREPVTLVASLGFPLLLLVLLVGSFGDDPPSPEYGGLGGTDFYVPVYLAAAIAAMGLLGVPTHVATYRETGVLSRFRVAGIGAGTIVAAQVAVTVMLAVVGAAVMVTLGFLAFGLSVPTSPVAVVVGFITGAVAFAALGVLLGSLLPSARAAQGLGLASFFGLFFIAGGGPPPALLPDVVNNAVDLTPMGPLVDAITLPWHQAGPAYGPLAVLTGIAVVAALGAARLLRASGTGSR